MHASGGRRSEKRVEYLRPSPHQSIVYSYGDTFYDRRPDAFIRKRKSNWAITRIELKYWPDLRTHLLTLHVGGVTTNAQRAESNERRDERFISTGVAGLAISAHEAILSPAKFVSMSRVSENP